MTTENATKEDASGQCASTAGLGVLRADFERWYMAEMDASAIFEKWCDTDYYEDSDIQRAWRSYQAGVQRLEQQDDEVNPYLLDGVELNKAELAVKSR